jgi:monovalent cation/proton antiporter MnhG/PhaG subunit
MPAWKEVLVDTLLALTVLFQLVSAVGLLAMPHLFDRLHFLAPASTVAPILLAGAVVTVESLDHRGILAVLIAVFFLAFQPVITHAMARAARIREYGDWRLRLDEKVRRP